MEHEEINRLIEQILTQLQVLRKRQVMVVGFGSNQEEKHIFEMLANHQSRCDFRFVFSESYRRLFDVSQWSKLGYVIEAFDAKVQSELQGVDLILIPFLTRNSLAKIASGIADNTALSAVNQGLLMGKQVLASTHCWRMDSDFAVFKGLNQSTAYQKLYEQHQQQIEALGVTSVGLQQWKALFEKGLESNENLAIPVQQPEKKRKNRGILTLADVQGNPAIQVDSSTRMTDLAREFLAAYQSERRY